MVSVNFIWFSIWFRYGENWMKAIIGMIELMEKNAHNNSDLNKLNGSTDLYQRDTISFIFVAVHRHSDFWKIVAPWAIINFDLKRLCFEFLRKVTTFFAVVLLRLFELSDKTSQLLNFFWAFLQFPLKFGLFLTLLWWKYLQILIIQLRNLNFFSFQV